MGGLNRQNRSMETIKKVPKQVSGPRPFGRPQRAVEQVSLWSASALLLAGAWIWTGDKTTPEFDAGLDSITAVEIGTHINFLAGPELEGRDTPSTGLTTGLQHGAAKLERLGYKGLGPDGAFLIGWTYPTPLEAPIAKDCTATIQTEGVEELRTLALNQDYVPLPGANGAAAGELVFLGFGIHAPKDKYDDLKGGKLKGKVAMFFSEEPRHKKVLEGPEISSAANVYEKLKGLEDEGLAGAVIIRRPVADNEAKVKGAEELEAPKVELGFRHTWATWNDQNIDRAMAAKLPAIEISVALANELACVDLLKLAGDMDKSAKTKRVDLEGVSIAFDVKTDKQTVEAHNLVGYLEGSDPELKKEVVVLGAHFDHLGMDARGRMAAGADDNASGSAALLEVAEALSLAKPRRSIVIAGFSGEEDGLLGSRAFCEFPPIEKTSMIAMLNMDMIGRGKDSSVVVLGAEKLRDMEKFLDRGDKLAKTGIKKIVTNKGQELWQRSDHYSFYEAGVPVLFFFEAVPITDNEDYHTWRDTPELVNIEKVTNTARLVYNTAWLIAQDDDRPRME